MAQRMLAGPEAEQPRSPQKDVYMKPLPRKFIAGAGLALLAFTTSDEALSQNTVNPNTTVPVKTIPRALQAESKDETNSSPRERGRILVKLNPIASEYQVFGDIGTSPGADADGEGVDFRSFFPSNNPADKPTDSLAIGYSLNYNDQSGIGKNGYNLSFNKKLNKSGTLVLSAQTRASASDRLIEHYESVWLNRKDTELYYLDRPRFSFDKILTENTVTTAQLGFRPNSRNSLYFKTFLQDYFDDSYRNRLELQFGSASVVEGSETIAEDGSITAATFEGARTRRYFGDTQNNRIRQHNSFGGTYTGDEWTIDYAIYAQKWNLDRQWYNWNFRDTGLDLSYSVDDPYLPTITENGETDLQDITQAKFSNLRIHNSYTRDRDLAARIDAERSLMVGDREIWIQTGALHREKEREVWEDRIVFIPDSSNTLTLADVAYEGEGSPLLDGNYTVPLGLDPAKGRARVVSNPEQFPRDSFREKTETAQQSYSAEESVTSTYFLGTQEAGDWTFEVGGRFEYTKTATRGMVVIPEAVNDATEGEFLESVTSPSDGSQLIIKNLYSNNSYNNFIPSAEVLFKATPSSQFKAAWFQLLMRPQYFNIVDYRRVSIPTRTISEGNPNLAPTEIDKLRFSWTKENEQIGTFSAEAYLISIENFFYGSVSEETILEEGQPVLYRVSRVENGDKANIKGLELQWSKTVSEFAFFDKASATLAYTFSDSDATVQSRPNDDLPTPERSDHLLNLKLSGTIGNLTSGIEFVYQSEALDDLGSSFDQDEYREPVVRLSLRNRYKINQSTSVSLNLSNLTDHPERSYEGSPIRVTRNQYSSWFGTFGLVKTF